MEDIRPGLYYILFVCVCVVATTESVRGIPLLIEQTKHRPQVTVSPIRCLLQSKVVQPLPPLEGTVWLRPAAPQFYRV